MKSKETFGFIRDYMEVSFSVKALAELLQLFMEIDKPFRIKATGFSMKPFIMNGDTITISPLPSERPQLGDVVAFVQPITRKLVVHRVVKIRDGNYIIKGDNVKWPDGQVPRINILGYVTRIERNLRPVSLGSDHKNFLIAVMSRWSLLVPSIRLFSTITGRSKT